MTSVDVLRQQSLNSADTTSCTQCYQTPFPSPYSNRGLACETSVYCTGLLWAWQFLMATRNLQLNEPAARFYHAAISVEGRVYVRGGRTTDYELGSEDEKIKLANCIEQFNPYLEVWCQLNTTGTQHPGLAASGCTSFGEHVYMYGGFYMERYEGVLSCLNVKTLTWSLLCHETDGGPMKKCGSGMFMFKYGDKIAVIGGYGIPTGPTQPGAAFTRDTKCMDGRGWSNEFHVLDISQGRHSQVH